MTEENKKLNIGLEVAPMVNLHFVCTGSPSPELGKTLANLQSGRRPAEYEAAAVVTGSMARDTLARSSRG